VSPLAVGLLACGTMSALGVSLGWLGLGRRAHRRRGRLFAVSDDRACGLFVLASVTAICGLVGCLAVAGSYLASPALCSL